MSHGENPVAVRVDAAAVEPVRDGETTGASADTRARSRQAEFDRRYAASQTPWASRVPSTELIRRLAELDLRPCHAIELGCGTGTNSIYLGKQGFSVVGVDISTTAISMARRTASKENAAVDLRVLDVCRLDASLGPFDLVFDRACYHFVRHFDLDGFRRSLWNVTRPGSVLILLAVSAHESRKGPPRVSATELVGELSVFFDLKTLREFQFDVPAASGWLGWSSVWSRRAEPRTVR